MYLTEEQAKNKELVCYLLAQIISEKVSKLKQITNGKNAYTYDVNDHMIVKFPMKRTPISTWLIQNKNAPFLQKILSFRIPKPKLKNVFLNSSSKKGLLSLSYEKIPGQIISRQDFTSKPIKFKQRFFEQLSDAAMQIHAIDPNRLPVIPEKTEEVARRLFPIRADNLFFNKIFSSLVHFPLIGFKEAPKRILCHVDLHSGNVCLDEKGKLVGLLDFDNLSQGDYFAEFCPNLYVDRNDVKMFREIYEKRSGKEISKEDIKRMDILLRVLSFVYDVVKTKKKIVSFKQPQKLLACAEGRDR